MSIYRYIYRYIYIYIYIKNKKPPFISCSYYFIFLTIDNCCWQFGVYLSRIFLMNFQISVHIFSLKHNWVTLCILFGVLSFMFTSVTVNIFPCLQNSTSLPFFFNSYRVFHYMDITSFMFSNFLPLQRTISECHILKYIIYTVIKNTWYKMLVEFQG